MPPKLGSKQSKRLKPGQIGVVCDECAVFITGDDGYLCVVDGHDGVKRWRAFHDGCRTESHVAGRGANVGRNQIVVRSSRVSTHSLLLTTLADLATDPRIRFADTAWPALLQRLAFDTDWAQTDGLKTRKELASEHREMVNAAGLNQQMKSADEVALDLVRKRNAYEYGRRGAEQT